MADLTGKLSGTGTLQGKISASVIDTTEIAQYNSIYEFPNRGSSGKLYIDMSENASYRWDEAASKYYCVGRDWTEIGELAAASASAAAASATNAAGFATAAGTSAGAAKTSEDNAASSASAADTSATNAATSATAAANSASAVSDASTQIAANTTAITNLTDTVSTYGLSVVNGQLNITYTV